MALHDVDVVAVRVQRRDLVLGALTAVVTVVVVGGDVRDVAESPTTPRMIGRGTDNSWD
jgi:hypothetical protein